MNTKNNYKQYHRGDLPHIQPKDGTFFITFRLDIPLSQEFYSLLMKKKEEINSSTYNIKDLNERNVMYNKKLFAFKDNYFDKYQHQDNMLKYPNIAKLIIDELHYQDKKLFDLFAYTVMPNHVHFLIKPLTDENGQYYSISKIMNLIKGRSSRFINLELKRSGTLWQREYYDHYVRNETELHNIIRYIALNPVKAGFVNKPNEWDWTWVAQEFINLLDDDSVKEAIAFWG